MLNLWSNYKKRIRSSMKKVKVTKFKIYLDEKGEYRWTLYAVNNKILADCSEGYTQKKDCMNGLQKVLNVNNETLIVDTTKKREYKKRATPVKE
jgi:uncharacterized protein YegP (UPF0339 family)